MSDAGGLKCDHGRRATGHFEDTFHWAKSMPEVAFDEFHGPPVVTSSAKARGAAASSRHGEY